MNDALQASGSESSRFLFLFFLKKKNEKSSDEIVII